MATIRARGRRSSQAPGSFFLSLNRSKKSVALDLKTPDGADVLRRLIETADVLIENFRPGSLADLGFDYAAASAINPRLIYCSISGYGQTGPSSQLAGYDAVLQGEAGDHGHDRLSGRRADARRRRDHTDYLAGLYAMQGILLALHERQASGLGQHVDVSLFEAMLSVMRLPMSVLLATGVTPSRVGNDHLNIGPYQPLRAKDGLIIVAVANPALVDQVLRGYGAPGLARRSAFQDEHRTRRQPRRAQGGDRGGIRGPDGRGVDRTPSGEECALRPRAIDRRSARAPAGRAPRDWMTQQHAQIGTIETLAPVVRLSRTPADVRLPAAGARRATHRRYWGR